MKLIVLGDFHDAVYKEIVGELENGVIPSIVSIAGKVGKSVTTTYKAMVDLENSGLLGRITSGVGYKIYLPEPVIDAIKRSASELSEKGLPVKQ